MTSNPMQDEMTQAALIVTDADREAYLSLNTLPAKYRDAVMAGEWDKTTGVQAFARHRHQAEQRGGEADAMREALEKIKNKTSRRQLPLTSLINDIATAALGGTA